jgi:hypothetical protein
MKIIHEIKDLLLTALIMLILLPLFRITILYDKGKAWYLKKYYTFKNIPFYVQRDKFSEIVRRY